MVELEHNARISVPGDQRAWHGRGPGPCSIFAAELVWPPPQTRRLRPTGTPARAAIRSEADKPWVARIGDAQRVTEPCTLLFREVPDGRLEVPLVLRPGSVALV